MTAETPPFDFDPVNFDPGHYGRIVFDIDGTLVFDDSPIPGAIDFVRWCRRSGVAICFATNATFCTGTQLAERLNRAGIECVPGEAVTAGEVLAQSLLTQCFLTEPLPSEPEQDPVAALVSVTVGALLVDAGVRLRPFVDLHPGEVVDHLVITGFLKDLATSDPQEILSHVGPTTTIHVGGIDHGMITKDGMKAGVGELLGQMEHLASTPLNLVVAGKPGLLFAQAIRDRVPILDAAEAPTLMLGDTLSADIGLGNLAGWDTLLVLTGATTAADLFDPQPTMVVSSLAALLPDEHLPASEVSS